MFAILCIAWIALVCFCAVESSFQPIYVTIGIDAENKEVQLEAFKLLRSIETIPKTHVKAVHVCLSYTDSSNLIRVFRKLQLLDFIHSISISHRLGPPNFSPSLNKLCAMDISIPPDSWMAYLDTDIFVAHDPGETLFAELLELENQINRNVVTSNFIVCGRAWRSFPGAIELVEYINPSFDPPQVDTIRGGTTFSGMCNTGVFFIPSPLIEPLMRRTYAMLQRFMNESCDEKSAYVDADLPLKWCDLRSFGVDSMALWGAMLQMVDVRLTATAADPSLFPSNEATLEGIVTSTPRLNYLAPADNLAARFLPSLTSSLSLIHFSHGSGFTMHVDYQDSSETLNRCDFWSSVSNHGFVRDSGADIAVFRQKGCPGCYVRIRTQWNEEEEETMSPVRREIAAVFSEPWKCYGVLPLREERSNASLHWDHVLRHGAEEEDWWETYTKDAALGFVTRILIPFGYDASSAPSVLVDYPTLLIGERVDVPLDTMLSVAVEELSSSGKRSVHSARLDRTLIGETVVEYVFEVPIELVCRDPLPTLAWSVQITVDGVSVNHSIASVFDNISTHMLSVLHFQKSFVFPADAEQWQHFDGGFQSMAHLTVALCSPECAPSSTVCDAGLCTHFQWSARLLTPFVHRMASAIDRT